jgi:Family of unknown function (DUF6263)
MYEYSNERSIQRHRNGGILEFSNSVKSIFYFKAVENGAFPTYELKYKVFEIINNPSNQIIDSKDDSSQFAKCLTAFKGVVMEFAAIRNDNLKIISGYSDFEGRINSLYRSYDDKKQNLPLPTEMVFTENYFIDFVKNNMLILPESKIEINSEWFNSEFFIISDDSIEYQVLYKIKKIENGRIYIDANGEFKESVPVDRNSTIIIYGNKNALIQIDAHSGMIIESESKVKVEGFQSNNDKQKILTIDDLTRIENVNFSENVKL